MPKATFPEIQVPGGGQLYARFVTSLGDIVIRLEEAYTYPNAAFTTDKIIDAAKAVTRRSKPRALKVGDRPWNDAGNAE